MNVGLPSGFIGFNTMAHRILLQIHHYGPATNETIAQDLCDTARDPLKAVSANLFRLYQCGFLNRVARHRKPGTRSCFVYDIAHKLEPDVRAVPLTGAQRSRLYRENKQIKAASIFNFRGRIGL